MSKNQTLQSKRVKKDMTFFRKATLLLDDNGYVVIGKKVVTTRSELGLAIREYKMAILKDLLKKIK